MYPADRSQETGQPSDQDQIKINVAMVNDHGAFLALDLRLVDGPNNKPQRPYSASKQSATLSLLKTARPIEASKNDLNGHNR